MGRTRITRSAKGDDFPTLIAEPRGATAQTFALAWSRNDSAVGERSAIWFGRATADGKWAKVAFTQKGYSTTPDLYATSTRLWLAWTRDGTPAVAWRTAAGWQTGKTFPRFDGMRPRDVYVAEREDGAWTIANATRTADGQRLLLALTSWDGRATLVFAAPRTGRIIVKTAV